MELESVEHSRFVQKGVGGETLKRIKDNTHQRATRRLDSPRGEGNASLKGMKVDINEKGFCEEILSEKE